MGRNFRAVMRVVKKYRSGGQYRARFYFAEYFEKNLPLNENAALFQSFDGKNFGGNPFYILSEMRRHPEWSSIEAYVAVNAGAVSRTVELVSSHGFKDCKVVAINSREYCQILSTAKYLINNSTFPTYFIKRDGQVYLNTWHGTPLKTMGRKMSDRPHTTGNTQRNFLMSDYLLYPNRFSFEHFREDYMVDKYFNGSYVLAGYPCNSIYFDNEARRINREKLGISDDTRLVVYMPTWRQTQKGGHGLKHMRMSEFLLMNLDEHLDENVLVFAKLHYYDSSKKISLNRYNKIKPFPADMETYEVLCAADVLVTDYSSVMFDFLNAGKRVILFNYDEEEYFSSRGTYLSLSDLPFERTNDSYDLCRLINSDENLNDFSQLYSKAISKFCSYDGPNAAFDMCKLLFDGSLPASSGAELISGDNFHTENNKVMIFGGALTKNGLTTALMGVLNNVDLNTTDYLLTFYPSKVKGSLELINSLSDQISYYPMQGSQAMTYFEAFARFLYYRFNRTGSWVSAKMNELYAREVKRLFPGMHFDSVIHFTGYERSMVHVMLNCNADNRVIYVHNDMLREKDLRSNYHVPAITLAYEKFDKIAVVRESLVDVISSGFGISRDKIYVVHNLNMIDQIRDKASLPIAFDADTTCNKTVDELTSVLNDSNITKFIDVARFSPEKGLERLIDAFVKYYERDPNSCLIIIGGLGKDYNMINEKVASIDNDRIFLIKNLSNPINILAKSDVFILSSFYEGLPMSIMEALILHKPVVSTAISGPKEFLEQGYGLLVDDSDDGVYRGLCAYKDGLLEELVPFNAEEFNQKALHEFLALIE